MSFDFGKAIQAAQADAKSALVGAIILGPSGAGKSSVLGTFGCKTLYLYTTGESHGVKAAMATGGSQIIPVCIDKDDEQLAPDAAYRRLLDILGEKDAIKKMGVGAVVIDGASELEACVRESTAWKNECKTAQGKHNSFAEPGATLALLRPVVNALKALQRDVGVHFAMTCILDVKEVGMYGEIETASPRLTGFSVAESLVQQFSEVLVVGRMVRDDVTKYKFQFMTDITKASKDEAGRIKRAINFNPRVTGLLITELPSTVDANLQEIIKLKAGKK